MKSLSADRFHHSDGSNLLDYAHPLEPSPISSVKTIHIIAGRPFENEVLGALLRHVFQTVLIRRYAKASDWDRTADNGEGEIVLYNLGDATLADPSVKASLAEFVTGAGAAMVIVMSQRDDAHELFDAIDCGAFGFIPANTCVEELVEVIRTPSLKSVVIPLSSMASLREAVSDRPEAHNGLEQHFTERQLDVAHALRRGAANKTIAFELGLCESTVKVHVRNIMRKLMATNRTQAAFRLNELANGNSVSVRAHEA